MKQNMTRFAISAVAILTANLLVEVLDHYFISAHRAGQPYWSATIRMAFIVGVFYPAFLLFRDMIEPVNKKYLKKSKNMLGGWFSGLLIFMTISFVLLLWGYAYFIYERHLFVDLYRYLASFF